MRPRPRRTRQLTPQRVYARHDARRSKDRRASLYARPGAHFAPGGQRARCYWAFVGEPVDASCSTRTVE